MSTQIGLAATTCIVNEYRASRNKPTVSYHCVQTYCKTSDYIKIMKRPVKKSGKDDPLSKWAKARLAQCLQYQKQLARGDEPDGDFTPIYLDGIGWWDEHHKQNVDLI